jgi:hypothetical protein
LAHQHADTPHALLRRCHHRPRRRAANETNKLPPPHVCSWARKLHGIGATGRPKEADMR